MRSRTRIFMLAAAVALPLMFAFPIWKITLEAPQYPKGLGMYIWVNKITGSEPNTLQNINIMNHYIGMKPIEPESIPELRFMRYIILALTGLALLLVFLNKWQLNLVWVIMLGMAYQPPLIGKKQILNFLAISLPRLGALFLALSILCGGLAAYFGIKNRRTAG
jgi:hypothetical protein